MAVFPFDGGNLIEDLCRHSLAHHQRFVLSVWVGQSRINVSDVVPGVARFPAFILAEGFRLWPPAVGEHYAYLFSDHLQPGSTGRS